MKMYLIFNKSYSLLTYIFYKNQMHSCDIHEDLYLNFEIQGPFPPPPFFFKEIMFVKMHE